MCLTAPGGGCREGVLFSPSLGTLHGAGGDMARRQLVWLCGLSVSLGGELESTMYPQREAAPAIGCCPQPGAAIPSQGHQGREGAFPFSGAPAPRGCGRRGRERVSQSAWVPAALQPAKGTRNCHCQPSSHGTGDSADGEPGQELGREAWGEEGVPCLWGKLHRKHPGEFLS